MRTPLAHGPDGWHPCGRDREAARPPAGGAPSCRPAPGEQRALSLNLSPARTSPSRERRVFVTTPVKRKRGEGQWKLGYREPLNPNERTKKDDDGLNVRARIENVYAKRGFDSIDPADLRGRMRWWGLYTQRKPGIDGGRTAVLEPEELDDRYFMLRVRIDGGALTTSQLRTLGEISQTYARDTADVTDRQNIQYHWIDIVDMPAIWQRLESRGHAHHRGVRRHPARHPRLAGRGHRRRRRDRPAARHRHDPRAVDRQPRVLQPAAQVQDRDLVAAGRRARGQRRLVRRGRAPRARARASTCGSAAASPPTRRSRSGSAPGSRSTTIPDVWAGIVSIFRDYGYRRLRHRARIKFLVADWGAAEFRRVLEEEYLGRALPTGPRPRSPRSRSTTSACTSSATAATTSASPPPPAGSRAPRWWRWPTPPSAPGPAGCGSPRSRRSSCWTCPTRRSTRSPASSPTSGCRPSPSPWRRATMACTGIEFCKLAIVETKERAIRLVDDLEKRLADVYPGAPISIHLNGCPNACARTQVADIGLKGMIVTDREGNQVEGFQVHLGGGLGPGRRVRPQAARAEGHQRRAGEYVERVVRRLRRAAHRGRALRAVGAARRRGRSEVSDGNRRGAERGCALLLPVLRRRGPASLGGRPTAPGTARPACARSR